MRNVEEIHDFIRVRGKESDVSRSEKYPHVGSAVEEVNLEDICKGARFLFLINLKIGDLRFRESVD